jgi:Uma2 family endonuclease
MATLERLMTAEELLHTAGLGPCELLRGELVVMSPAGFEHGRIANRIAVRLGGFVERHSLGIVTTAETGFQIGSNPDTVRVPDIAFVAAARVPPAGWARFFAGPPDLAVEILSPSDRASEVLAKVQEWLSAGCRAVWLIDPPSRTLTVYGPRREALVLRESDTLDGGDLLPGFSVAMADVLGE